MGDDIILNYSVIREKAIGYMLDHGWKEQLAKSRAFEQSLFDHTLVMLDALIALLPILNQTFQPPLKENEEKILLAGVVAHDSGKDRAEFQEYIKGKRGFVSDVHRATAEMVVSEVASLLDIKDKAEILSAVLLHMRHERTPANMVERVIFGDHADERWKTLADIVDAVDNLCSIKGLFPCLNYLETRASFAHHIRTAYHLVQLRGVSTTLLHRAAIDAFSALGWSPLLHFSNGSIYIASPIKDFEEAPIDDIEARFAQLIEDILPEKLSYMVVGSPLQSMMPKPELFDYRELKSCLEIAAGRVKRNSFLKKSAAQRRKTISRYYKQKGLQNEVDDHVLARESERIARAQPEMCIFKFFKAALSEDLLGSEVLPETAAKYGKNADQDVKEKKSKITSQLVAEIEYDAIFGESSYKKLQALSTLDPGKDMALCVDQFWQLSGEGFGLDITSIEYLDDQRREKLLIDILDQIASKIYQSIPEEKRPTRAMPKDIARCFMGDLIHPAPHVNLQAIVSMQMQAYAESKNNARSVQGEHLCPICNQTFTGGTEAKANYLENPDCHTNRAPSHCGGGKIVICDACKLERFLQQLILGTKVSGIVVLFPRMNIGHASGQILCQKAYKILNGTRLLMTKDNPNPDQNISLAMTWNMAHKLSEVDVYRLSPEEIVDLMTYQVSDEKVKEHRQTLIKLLKELYETDELSLDVLNGNWATEYQTVDEALDALIVNRVLDDDALNARTQAYNLNPSLQIVCQTPHLILIPLSNPISIGDESDTNDGIRELFFTLMLGLALDSSVAVMKAGEVITFEGGEGVARVPSVPALRDLLSAEWVPIDCAKKWLDAIAAAALLTNATNFPKRSNLYAILKSPTAGHVLRRIEQKNESGQASWSHFQLLEKVKEVLR